MFPFPIAKRQKCDIQQFYSTSTWNKPPGVSHVYMLLIGGGGTGNGASAGGASGSVAVWYGAAQHIPDSLRVQVGVAATSASTVSCVINTGTFSLISAGTPASNTVAGTPAANNFTISGFFTGTNGQAGANSIGPSGVTFLSGGANVGTVVANYKYENKDNGYFQLQPIPVGTGGLLNGVGGIGCGGGANSAKGGNGFVLIASW